MPQPGTLPPCVDRDAESLRYGFTFEFSGVWPPDRHGPVSESTYQLEEGSQAEKHLAVRRSSSSGTCMHRRGSPVATDPDKLHPGRETEPPIFPDIWRECEGEPLWGRHCLPVTSAQAFQDLVLALPNSGALSLPSLSLPITELLTDFEKRG